MSDVDIELFSIKDPRPLTAKLKSASDTDFEDMFSIDDQKMDQLNFDSENVFDMTSPRNMPMVNSSVEMERTISGEDRSAGEKRGNNKVSSSNTQKPHPKRKARKKDGKRRKTFKRIGVNSSTSLISYQSHVKNDENDNKTANVQMGKGASKLSKDKTSKKKNSQIRGKSLSDQKQTISPIIQTQNKTHHKDIETCTSSGAESPSKRSESAVKSKEKRKPNYEHIAKLAETNMGCNHPGHSNPWGSPSLPEGVTRDDEPMEESCDLMEVCDSRENENAISRDNVIIDDETLTHNRPDTCPENLNNMDASLEESLTEIDHTQVDLPTSRPRVRLTNLSLSMPNTREKKRSEDEDTNSTWLLDCRNIWSSGKLKQKIYQSSEFRERSYQNIKSQVEISVGSNKKPVKTNTRYQGMRNSGQNRGCIMRTVKQGSFVLMGTVKTIKDDRDRLTFNF